MTLSRYISWVTVALLPLAGSALIWGSQSPRATASAGLGAGIASLNAVAAYGIVLWARSRPVNTFLGLVLGGTLLRMVAMLVGMVLAIRGLSLDAFPLVAALIFYFVLFLALEVKVLPKQITVEAR